MRAGEAEMTGPQKDHSSGKEIQKTKNCRDWVLVATHSEYEGKWKRPLSLELQGPGERWEQTKRARPHW